MVIKIEEGGKISIPQEYLKELRLNNSDEVKVFIRDREIVIRRLILGCVFCDAAANLVRIGRYCVCRSCIEKLYNAKNDDYFYPVWR